MLKPKIYTFLIFIFVYGCSVQTEIANDFEIRTERKKIVRIQGIAYNAKGGAVVVADAGSNYYVGNIKQWKERFLYESVSVVGRLIVVTNTNLDSNRVVGYLKRKQWIKRPLYRRIK